MKQDLLIEIKVDTESVNKAIKDIQDKIDKLKSASIDSNKNQIKELETKINNLKKTTTQENDQFKKREENYGSFIKRLESAYRRKEAREAQDLKAKTKLEEQELKKREKLEYDYNKHLLQEAKKTRSEKEKEEQKATRDKEKELKKREKLEKDLASAILKNDERIRREREKEANKPSITGQVATGIVGGNLLMSGINTGIGIVKDAYRSIKDYSGAVAELRATTQDATKAEQDFLVQMSLNDKSIFSAKEIIQANTELAKRGYNANEISLLSPNIMQGAQAFGASPDEVADLIGSTLSIYSKGAESSKEVTDQLAKAADISALSFENLKYNIATVAPVAKMYGFELSETLTLMAKAKDAGFNASTGATALRNIFLNLADPAGSLAKRLKEPVTDMESLVKGLKQLESEGLDLAHALDLTDKRSVSVFLSLLEGSDGLIKKNEQIVDSYGFVENKSRIMTDSLQGDIERAGKTWEKFVLRIGSGEGVIGNALNGIAKLFGNIIRDLDELDLKFTRSEKYSQNQRTRAYNSETIDIKTGEINYGWIIKDIVETKSAKELAERYFSGKKGYENLGKEELRKQFKNIEGINKQSYVDQEIFFEEFYKNLIANSLAEAKAAKETASKNAKLEVDRIAAENYAKTHPTEEQEKASKTQAEIEYYKRQKEIQEQNRLDREREKKENEEKILKEKQGKAELELLKLKADRELEMSTNSSNRLKAELDNIDKLIAKELELAEVQGEKDVINQRGAYQKEDVIRGISNERAKNSQSLEEIRIQKEIDALEPHEVEEKYKLEQELLTSNYEFELHALQVKNESSLILTAEYNAALIKMENDKTEALKEIKDQEQQTILDSTASMLSTIASLYSEDSKKHKRLATASSLVNLYAGLVKINTTYGTNPILAGILTAKLITETGVSIAKINKVKFEKGGYVYGNRHASGGVSNGNIELEGGEFVNNRESTYKNLPLLKSINQRGRHIDIQAENDAKMMRMLSNLPNPIVSVKEISTLQKRVSVKEKTGI